MTTAAEDSPPTRRRWLGNLGKALDARLSGLGSEYLGQNPRARADVARLRRALGKPAGSTPDIWEYTLAAVPASLQWDRDEPSRAEQAAEATLTLFALHQQGMSVPAHQPQTTFGQAVARLAAAEQRSEQAVTRRFMAVTTSGSINEMLTHIRGLITQMRAAQIGFDYARLADDLMALLSVQRAQRVRLAWGRDFYRTAERPEADSASGSTTTESEN